MDKPLAGVTVLDLSAVIMGPWATHLLALQGASVWKVEAPGGDTMRVADPHGHPGLAPIFRHSNRGKKSIVLDLKRPEARGVTLRLATQADVLVHNIRPAAAERLGLGWDVVRAVNPRIVYAALTGFGSAGPYAGRPAYDDLIQGASGLAGLSDPPRYTPSLIADRYVGVYAAQAILAALLAARTTGEGRAIEVPMFEVMSELVLADHLGGLTFVPSAGPPGYSRLLAPDRRPYRCSDGGWISVIVYTEKHWRAFFAVASAEERYLADPVLSDPAARRADYAHAYAVVAELIAGHPAAWWLEQLAAADVPAMPVGRVETLAADPHLRAAGVVREADGERSVGSALGYADTTAPRLGEHTRELLATAGYGSAEIESLIASGAAA
jgi:crotonobetainyl-CoA:carnitine CoA-transferase CaiB-like acyl-CoA transferase